MSTSDKLEYLIETKNQIKEAIVNKGVTVTDEDDFRSYAEKIAEIKTVNAVEYTKQINMEEEEKEVLLRKLVASEGKVIVSKLKDEEGNAIVKGKEVYLAMGDSEDNYEEIYDL